MISRTSWSGEIVSAASAVDVSPDLVEAIVLVESGGNEFAINAEPRYPYLWDVRARAPFRTLSRDEIASKVPPPDFHSIAGDRDQEWWAQQVSFGLMQIMGALARELGFRGPYLTELCRPDVNLRLGCKHLASLLRWSGGDQRRAVGAYNAGRGAWNSSAGQIYQGKVLETVAQLAPLP